jgi:hypothetical protein
MKKCGSLFMMLYIVCNAFSQNVDYGITSTMAEAYRIKDQFAAYFMILTVRRKYKFNDSFFSFK